MVALILVSTINRIRHVVITRTCADVGLNVITQSSTNQIHPAEIPQTSNLCVCKFTRSSSSSACKGLAPRLVGKPLFTNSSIMPHATGVQFSLGHFVLPPLSYMKQVPFESAGIRPQSMLKLAVLPDCFS